MLRRDDTTLVVVDVQEAFRPAVLDFERVAQNTAVLVEGARAMGLPVVATEQYPEGLGATVPEVAEHLPGKPLDKVRFSAAAADGFSLDGRDQVLVCGIEAHVCVSQTALALLAEGREVHVPRDAVTSRTEENREVGLRRMEREGAVITSVEAALFVLLGDGTRFDGELVGAPAPATGEVVFNTSMSGYQEAVSDPSYRGQVIVFTYPHIGNYGVAAAHMESDSVHARAVIMREGIDREDAPRAEAGWLTWLADCGIPALSGVDTRTLVRHLRSRGAMRGGVFAAETPEGRAMERVRAEPEMSGQDLVREVTPREPVILEGAGPRVVALDTGIKDSIVRNLRERGASVE